jgi:hypothetical protein
MPDGTTFSGLGVVDIAVASAPRAQEKAWVRGTGEISNCLFKMNWVGGLRDDDGVGYERCCLGLDYRNHSEQSEDRENKTGTKIVHKPSP